MDYSKKILEDIESALSEATRAERRKEKYGDTKRGDARVVQRADRKDAAKADLAKKAARDKDLHDRRSKGEKLSRSDDRKASRHGKRVKAQHAQADSDRREGQRDRGVARGMDKGNVPTLKTKVARSKEAREKLATTLKGAQGRRDAVRKERPGDEEALNRVKGEIGQEKAGAKRTIRRNQITFKKGDPNNRNTRTGRAGDANHVGREARLTGDERRNLGAVKKDKADVQKHGEKKRYHQFMKRTGQVAYPDEKEREAAKDRAAAGSKARTRNKAQAGDVAAARSRQAKLAPDEKMVFGTVRKVDKGGRLKGAIDKMKSMVTGKEKAADEKEWKKAVRSGDKEAMDKISAKYGK